MDVATVLGLGVKISIFITVLSLGMRASLSDIAHLFRRPGLLLRALVSIFVIMTRAHCCSPSNTVGTCSLVGTLPSLPR